MAKMGKKGSIYHLLAWYVTLPTEATPTAVPVQKTSSASPNSSTDIALSSTWFNLRDSFFLLFSACIKRAEQVAYIKEENEL